MKFIAYFDYLGFSDFIQRNDLIYQRRYIGNIFRDIESALAKGKLKDGRPGTKIADLSDSSIHCINFSDTVVFWTKDDSIDSLRELLEVTFYYNLRCIDYFFPARGSICWGEIISYNHFHESKKLGTYAVNSVFGKGLVSAHAKAESQDWAGTVIDASVITYLNNNQVDLSQFLSPFAKEYLIPYKQNIIGSLLSIFGTKKSKEWALNLVEIKEPLNDTAFGNIKKNIIDNFAKHNKRTNSKAVQRKIRNTVAFLESYR